MPLTLRLPAVMRMTLLTSDGVLTGVFRMSRMNCVGAGLLVLRMAWMKLGRLETSGPKSAA